MEPVAATATAAAILEGYRRATWRSASPAVRSTRERLALTDIVENATEHAQALVPRDPNTGLRLDRKV